MSTVASYQLLTFTMSEETYALEVASTREVLEYSRITPIPRTPKWIRGVLNLRGAIIPVLDLKQKLQMGTTENSRDACVLILELLLDGEPTVVGILADSVKEVFEIDAKEIEPPPRFGAKISTEYLRGVGRRNEALFILLDVQRIFAASDLSLAEQTAEAAEAAALEFARTAGNMETSPGAS
jgi:purine-binding chemotaxis protein CheW